GGRRPDSMCGPNEYCDYVGETCGEADQGGVCRSRVPASYCGGPICGCDGKTYLDACNAHSRGFDTKGSTCVPGNGGAGANCIKDGDCQAGFKCCVTGGAYGSPIACKQLPPGTDCPR